MESPSDDEPALARFADWFVERVTTQFGAKAERLPHGHLACTFGDGGPKQIMVLGHYDTVWPMETIRTMPFREADGRLWGPGVLDMKGGVAMFLMAARALRELGIPMPGRVLLQLNADEETGSRTSREFTEANAKQSHAVLVVEPGTGLTGKMKTARKGVGGYTLRVTGRASHAGVDFSAGASAVLELSRQLLTIAEWTDPDRGITVNPGVINGGTRSNVVPAEASAQIDVRIAKLADAASLDERFRSLRPVDDRCALSVEGGLNRPPMERTPPIESLFRLSRELGRQIGVDVEESATGGGSDGNFTAALGVPTLDGVGAVGEGAHASNESILVGRIADRTAMLAMLLGELSNGDD
jgi:glutamate carboxypeptidase